ncbi:hypothetical protein [unidentified bacterial endosymbiont]|uniref:hypothetical protein n=1 Tax=unidentified bacterial endosymbiont TaxID=2355 RepID=UPI00209DDE66|nr:hypothetical protein [unidentified bacterial endosymbiont]
MSTFKERFFSSFAENPPLPGVRINSNMVRSNTIRSMGKETDSSTSSEETDSSGEKLYVIPLRGRATVPSPPQQTERSTSLLVTAITTVSTIVSTTLAPLTTGITHQVTHNMTPADNTSLVEVNLVQNMVSDTSTDESTGWMVGVGVTAGVVILSGLVIGGVCLFSKMNRPLNNYSSEVMPSVDTV